MKMTAFYFSLLLLPFITACKKDSLSEDKFPYYFTATINSIPIKYDAGFMSRTGCGSASILYDNVNEYDLYEGTFIKDYDDVGKNNIYVYVLKHFSAERPSAEQRLSMFQVGNYNYGRLNANNGVVIIYTDENGVTWNSEGGSQDGSTFTLTEIVDDEYMVEGKRIKADFNCKLYDGNGASIQVTNAKISGRVLEF